MALCAAVRLLEGKFGRVRSADKTVMYGVSWVSARSEAFCPTYLTLQDAVSCFLCALGQATIRSTVDLWHLAR
jgi:hypothetical protein